MTSTDLLQPMVLRGLCARAGIRPARASGQHFLINARTLARIVDAVDQQPGDTTLEVGAGFGILTLALASQWTHREPRGRMIAIERDHRITPILREFVAPYGSVEVVESDVLQRMRHGDLVEVLAGSNAGPQRATERGRRRPWMLVANLPYGITSEFLSLLFDAVATGALPPPRRAVFLLQREVVDRLTDRPGARGLLTIIAELHSRPRLVTRVPASHFWPPPRVESAVVALEDWRDATDIRALVGDRDAFLSTIRAGFTHPRRQLLVNLSHGRTRDRLSVQQALTTVGLPLTVRPADLTFEQWMELHRTLG